MNRMYDCDTMVSNVAAIDIDKDVERAFKKALTLIDIDDLNTKERPVAVKVGVFNHKKGHHYTTVDCANAIVKGFDKASTVYVVESDNYKGKGSERLQIYKDVFSNHVVPFNLSEDSETKEVQITDEKIGFSHILFKPTVMVSTHVLREAEIGSILKNLLGLIPDRKKARFHTKLVPALLDTYEAIGGIDLAVLDGTFMYSESTDVEYGVKTNVLIVGRDAVAVEAVGLKLVGLNPESIPIIQEAVKRGLGEGNLEKINILGSSLDTLTEKIQQQLKNRQ
ncbi:MAG: DUF362 domain-containing protein [Theionarchaea archaeon]|nr:MAG: hypothetical protein AYK19_16550 [Theionarchaea archaeon DG-70-1]MBU7029600.1 DUF362 domain-containing protein [Theionarchaea archaeon]